MTLIAIIVALFVASVVVSAVTIFAMFALASDADDQAQEMLRKRRPQD